MSGTVQGGYGSTLGSFDMTQHQSTSANHMASQLQVAANQLAATPDPATHNPLAYRQLMLQVGSAAWLLPGSLSAIEPFVMTVAFLTQPLMMDMLSLLLASLSLLLLSLLSL